MRIFSKILVYLDGSEESLDAFDYALSLSIESKTTLNVIYVINTKVISSLSKGKVLIFNDREDYLSGLKNDAEKNIKYAKRSAEKKGIKIEIALSEGTPHKIINQYIESNKIDLLVIGTVAEVRSRREEIVSENDRLLRSAACPVLVVKSNLIKERS